MAEVRLLLAQMKANGVTIQWKPALGNESGYLERTMQIVDEEARALGMTYGDAPDPKDAGVTS